MEHGSSRFFTSVTGLVQTSGDPPSPLGDNDLLKFFSGDDPLTPLRSGDRDGEGSGSPDPRAGMDEKVVEMDDDHPGKNPEVPDAPDAGPGYLCETETPVQGDHDSTVQDLGDPHPDEVETVDPDLTLEPVE